MKKINIDKEWLLNQYITLNKTIDDISNEFNFSRKSISRRIKEYGLIKSNDAKNESISQKRQQIQVTKEEIYDLYIFLYVFLKKRRRKAIRQF